MRAVRLLWIAACLAAILFVLVVPASAECPPEDPECRIAPPPSIEVIPYVAVARGTLDEVADPGSLPPVSVPVMYIEAVPLEDNPAPSFPHLELPLRLQNASDVSCGVQALGMALDGLDGSAPTSDSLLGFLQGNGMMYEFGTGVEELAYAALAFGYGGSHAFHGAALGDLAALLRDGLPVVVSLGTNGEGHPGHFVTVTGISADGKWVSFNDPALGEQVMALNEFMRLWGLQGNSGVAVRLEPPAGAPDYSPWVVFAAALMAWVSTTPLVMRRMGIGGAADAGGGGGGSSKPATSSKSSTTGTKTAKKTSSTKKSSSSKSSSKTSATTKAAATPVVVDNVQSEMKDLKAVSTTAAGSGGNGSKPATTSAGSASSALDKVKDVDVGGGAAGGSNGGSTRTGTGAHGDQAVLQVLSDPSNDPILAKGQASGSSPASAAQPVTLTAGALDARLGKVEEVVALGGVAATPPEMPDLVEEIRNLKPAGSGTGPALEQAIPALLTAEERLRLKVEDVYVGQAVEDQRKLLTELIDAVAFKVAGSSFQNPARPAWISAQDWNHMPIDDRQAVAAWQVKVILEGMAPYIVAGAEAVERVKDGFIDWISHSVIPGCADRSGSLPSADQLAWIYAKNSPGGQLVELLWVTDPGGMNYRTEPWGSFVGNGLEYRSVLQWDRQVRADSEGMVWYHVTDGIQWGWVSEVGLAAYRPSNEWTFGCPSTPPPPMDPAIKTYGYGEGAEGWSGYWTNGQNPYTAQYLNIKAILTAAGMPADDLSRYASKKYVNRCGEITVGHAFNLPLETVFLAASSLFGDTLKADHCTTPDELLTLIRLLGSSARQLRTEKSAVGLQSLTSLADEGKVVIINVTVIGGSVHAPHEVKGKPIEHWVQVISSGQGTCDVYNSLTNSVETWEETELVDSMLNIALVEN